MLNEIIHINWEDFHFLRPMFLWLMIPAFIVLVVGLIGLREEVKWKKVIAPHLRPYIIRKGSENIKKRMQILSFIFIIVAILGLSGPTWNTVKIPGQTLETPVVIVLDLSQSMMATDIQPNRLERATFKINDLLDANPKARVALVGYSGTAHTIIPLTNDYKIIKSHLGGLSPQIMPFPGTNLEAALEVADTITNVTTAPATILLFTDDCEDETFQLLQNFSLGNEIKIVMVPVNTVTGAEIPDAESNRSIRDKSGKIIRSAINQEVLDKINSLENVKVHQLTLDKSDMEVVAQNISASLEFKEEDQQKEDDWKDRGLWLAIPFAFFVLMWFRRGWVIFSMLIFVTFSSCKYNSKYAGLWFTRDYMAQKLSNEGNYEEAAQLYEDPLRKGVAFYKSGNFDEAISWFAKDTTSMGAYNLGLAYLKNGNFAAAAMAFGKAVEMDPDLNEARQSQQLAQQLIESANETNLEDEQEAEEQETAENIQNSGPEDLSGGGQEAKKEEMERERKEETVITDIRKGKELDEVPDDFESGKQDNSQKVLMRKVDDDPALFLKRKFAHQVKSKNIQPKNNGIEW